MRHSISNQFITCILPCLLAFPTSAQLPPQNAGEVIGQQIGNVGNSIANYRALKAERYLDMARVRSEIDNCVGCGAEEIQSLQDKLAKLKENERIIESWEQEALSSMGIRGAKNLDDLMSKMASGAEQYLINSKIRAQQSNMRHMVQDYCYYKLGMKVPGKGNIQEKFQDRDLLADHKMCWREYPAEFLFTQRAVGMQLCYQRTYDRSMPFEFGIVIPYDKTRYEDCMLENSAVSAICWDYRMISMGKTESEYTENQISSWRYSCSRHLTRAEMIRLRAKIERDAQLTQKDEEVPAESAVAMASGGELRAIDTPVPIYPRRAQSRGIEGYCTVEFTVATTGESMNPSVLDCVPAGVFERASIKAALKFKYPPQREDIPGVQHKFSYSLEN